MRQRFPVNLLAVLAVVGTAAIGASIARADFTFEQNAQLSPPRDSINYIDQTLPSVNFLNRLNATNGNNAGIQNEPSITLWFNGYDSTTAPANALNLHSQHGTAFIEPVVSASDFTHPNMFDLTLSFRNASGAQAITGIDFALDYNNNKQPGTVMFFLYDASGNLVGQPANPFDIKTSGQDKFAILGTNGETFTSLEIVTSQSAPMIDFKQGDIVVTGGGLEPLPEPASMTLCGIGVVGLGGLTWIRRRKLAIA